MDSARLLLLAVGLTLYTPTLEAPAPKAPKGNDRVVCRTFGETGSLVKRNKVCKTVAQWDAQRMQLRQPSGVTGCSIQPCSIPGK